MTRQTANFDNAAALMDTVVKTNPTKVMASFCHHLFFLESPETGADWTAKHGEGTFLVTLDEAFALGKRLNAAQFV